MRVFHVISHFDVGGAERVAVSIASSGTADMEYHVVELVRGRSAFTPVFVAELEAAGVRYHRGMVPDVRFHYVFERLAALTFPLWFLPLFLRYRPKVIHSHTEMPDMATWWFFTLFPRLLRSCSVVRTIHSTRLWTGMKRTGDRVEAFFKRHDSSVAISESTRDSYLAEYGSRVPIIYNGVSPVCQKPYEGIVKGKTNVLFAGRMEPEKGVSVMVEIVKRLRGDERYHFHVVGDGSLRGFVEAELGGQDNVTLRPSVYGLAAYMSSFDYLLMPSVFEGFGLMAVEASVAGVPVVANDCAGLRDTLPENWPLRARDNSVDDYARIFLEVIPRSDGKSLGAMAKSFVVERFGVERSREGYEKFYRSRVGEL